MAEDNFEALNKAKEEFAEDLIQAAEEFAQERANFEELVDKLRTPRLSHEARTILTLMFAEGRDTITPVEAVKSGCFRTESEFARGALNLVRHGLAKDQRAFAGVELKE